jgi:hypothetical protein
MHARNVISTTTVELSISADSVSVSTQQAPSNLVSVFRSATYYVTDSALAAMRYASSAIRPTRGQY